MVIIYYIESTSSEIFESAHLFFLKIDIDIDMRMDPSSYNNRWVASKAQKTDPLESVFMRLESMWLQPIFGLNYFLESAVQCNGFDARRILPLA